MNYTRKFVVVLMLFVVAGAFLTVHAFAQEGGSAEQAAAPEAREFTDEEVDSFLQVDAAVRRIQLEAARQTQAALDAADMTVEDYTAVIAKLRQDEAFLTRVKQRAAALSEQLQGEETA